MKETITFAELGLNEQTLAAIEKKGFKEPSPIQTLAIPRLLSGDANLIAKARTGTGKTAAFGLPIIQKITQNKGHVQVLVLTPTRELALQVCKELESLSSTGFPRLASVYGGQAMSLQLRQLRTGVEVVVGTPGRIKDHLSRKSLNLDNIDYFILDEADEMLNMGFIDDIEEIFSRANSSSRVLLFSATMPKEILKIASKFMGDYEVIEENIKDEEPILTEQSYWVVYESEK
ncbi:MAG: DEAD/DEAH box helicase, partial [Treponemataceae bacterium]